MRCTIAGPMPAPTNFVRRMQTLEDAEQLGRVAYVETGPVVVHKDGAPPAPTACAAREDLVFDQA
jgi:hypothetical protein